MASSPSESTFREAFKVSYLTRGRYRTTRRSPLEAARLGELARQLTELYLRVEKWNGFERVLRLSRNGEG